ncbi:hypothetical protein HC891_05920 [Candidatus Gracilibacteria bacterium]|nr:hypothetical protein [Candidatus Gracilibacteria bacterium]
MVRSLRPDLAGEPGDGTRPLYPGTRPAFFPSMQGNYQELFPEFPYTGGAILQHAPLFGTIGNHESPGRWRPNAQFQLNGITQTATIDFMDNDPQPRWFAEIQYQRLKDADPTFNPTNDPAFRTQWIRDNSYEFTQYFEMWNHPEDGPQGESYWAYQLGDVFVVSMNVSRVWRTWNIQEGPEEARFSPRGKFTEFSSELNDPSAWGFGDMWFETYGVDSEQYEWLQGVLVSEAFKNAKYRVVIGHQTMFGVGDNSVPVMANPVATITHETAGVTNTMTVTWPLDRTVWERDIQPLVDTNAIRDITYEYPLANDVWKNDIEPLLLEHDVQLMHTGHSHVWNRALVGDMNYIETSNVGNSFGAYYTDTLGLWKERVSWASSFWNELATPESRWDATNYPRTGDPHGRASIMPSEFNPMNELEGSERDLPFVDSNNVTAFTIFDTATGKVDSYAFDTRNPANPVRLFDSFTLKSAARFTSATELPQPVVGQAFSFQFTAEGNPTPTFSVSAGELPPGLTLSEDGLLSGVPSANGVYRFTVSATNNFGAPATQQITLNLGEQLFLPMVYR